MSTYSCVGLTPFQRLEGHSFPSAQSLCAYSEFENNTLNICAQTDVSSLLERAVESGFSENIVELKLEGITIDGHFTDDLVTFLPFFIGLQKLYLCNCQNVEVLLEALSDPEAQRQFGEARWKGLCVSNNADQRYHINEEKLANFIDQNREVVNLQFEGLCFVTLSRLELALSQCRSLKVLILRDLTLPVDEISSLAEKLSTLPSLESVSITRMLLIPTFEASAYWTAWKPVFGRILKELDLRENNSSVMGKILLASSVGAESLLLGPVDGVSIEAFAEFFTKNKLTYIDLSHFVCQSEAVIHLIAFLNAFSRKINVKFDGSEHFCSDERVLSEIRKSDNLTIEFSPARNPLKLPVARQLFPEDSLANSLRNNNRGLSRTTHQTKQSLNSRHSSLLQQFFVNFSSACVSDINAFLSMQFAHKSNSSVIGDRKFIVLKSIDFFCPQSIRAFFDFLRSADGANYSGLILEDLIILDPKNLAKEIENTPTIVCLGTTIPQLSDLKDIFESSVLKDRLEAVSVVSETNNQHFDPKDKKPVTLEQIRPLVNFIEGNTVVKELFFQGLRIAANTTTNRMEGEISDKKNEVAGPLAAALRTASQLTSLNFRGCRFTHDAVLELLTNILEIPLRRLCLQNVSAATFWESECFASISAWSSVALHPTLQDLDVSGNVTAGQEVVTNFLQACGLQKVNFPQLEIINLERNDITSTETLSWVLLFPKVREIQFSRNDLDGGTFLFEVASLEQSDRHRQITIFTHSDDSLWDHPELSNKVKVVLEPEGWEITLVRKALAVAINHMQLTDALVTRPYQTLLPPLPRLDHQYAQRPLAQSFNSNQVGNLRNLQLTDGQKLLKEIEEAPVLTQGLYEKTSKFRGWSANQTDVVQKAAFLAVLKKIGLKTVQVLGDGSCLFHSVALWQKCKRQNMDTCRQQKIKKWVKNYVSKLINICNRISKGIKNFIQNPRRKNYSFKKAI